MAETDCKPTEKAGFFSFAVGLKAGATELLMYKCSIFFDSFCAKEKMTTTITKSITTIFFSDKKNFIFTDCRMQDKLKNFSLKISALLYEGQKARFPAEYIPKSFYGRSFLQPM